MKALIWAAVLAAASSFGVQAQTYPARAATVIVDAVVSKDAPLRLLLGSQALGAIQSIRDRVTDMERSNTIAPRADYPE